MHCAHVSFAVAWPRNELRLRLERRGSSTSGEVGTSTREPSPRIRSFFLPRGFQLGTGFVFDANGNISNQQDIVIFRKLLLSNL